MNFPENFTLDDLDSIQIIDDTRLKKFVNVRLGLMCTLYLRNPHSRETRMALAECGNDYQKRFGSLLKCYNKPDGSDRVYSYPVKGVDLVEYVKQEKSLEDCFMPTFYGDKNPQVAAYGFYIEVNSTDAFISNSPAFFHATLPFGWLKDKEGERAYQNLVHDWCKILKPFHGYAGLGAIESMEAWEKGRAAHLVYPLAIRFPGLEVDDPSMIAAMMIETDDKETRNKAVSQMMYGVPEGEEDAVELLQEQGAMEPLKIKGVNWLTALDDECFERLGGREAVLSDLGDGFVFYEYKGGVLIQAGPTPQLGDVNRKNIPRHYKALARKLKPIRLIYPETHTLLQPPDGKRDSTEATNEWLARFD